jgi:hypothetical protein
MMPTTTTTMVSAVGTQIFQVEFRNCHVLHVGYQRIKAGTAVHWVISQQGHTLATGQFVTVAGKGYHFLSMPMSQRFAPTPRKGLVVFSWQVGSTAYHYSAKRATDC